MSLARTHRPAVVIAASGLAAHADQHDLLHFLQRMRHPPRHVRLVHGEPDAQQALKAAIEVWAASVGHALHVTLASPAPA
ncbi:MBL fold metallo-hydrolase RNA specificity domain-containing protein [Halomonas sp. NO4]|uniref:MBL fold metallo-hydrolase RNA specificity domain-containing protein n=1 Tax=Halomonas sp. NO4 TaxID=2484813 RepID=UPI001F089163|nr:MBL fold metallo-hydrolase RNA specificity domain-containing protein [Halomonas sp. NO4]